MKKILLTLLIICNISLFSSSQFVYGQDKSAVNSLLNRLRMVTNDTSKVRILTELCKKHLNTNIEEAEGFARQALQISEKILYREGISASYSLIGTVYLNDGNYNKSIEYFEKSMIIDEELDNKIGISYRLNNIGIIYYYQSNYAKAIEYFKKALSINEKLDDKIGISGCSNNIGNLYSIQGNYDKASKYLYKSLKIDEEIGDKIGISDCLNNIGNIIGVQGNYTKAIEYYPKSLKLKIEIGNKRGISECLNNIGNELENFGNYTDAIKYYQKSLKLAEELGDKIVVSNNLSNIGIVLDILGDYTKAIEYHQKSLSIKKELGDKNGVSSDINSIGKSYLNQNKYNKALTYFKRALKINHEIGAQIAIVYSNNLLGELHQKQADYKKSLQYYQKALIMNINNYSDSTIYNNPKKINAISKPYLLESLGQKAKTFYLLSKKENRIKNIKASMATYELVFKLIYELHNDYSHESTKLLLSEKTKSYFRDALYTSITYNKIKPSQENVEKVFEYFEKSKSTSLGAYLSDLKLKQHWNITDSILEKEEDIAINRRFYETEIQKLKAKQGGYDTLLEQNYQDKLFSYSRQYDTLINTLKNKYPDYYRLKYEQKVASVEETQNQLDENTALINYFVADSSVFIAAITKDHLTYKVVKIDSSFNQKIIDYHIDVKFDFAETTFKASTQLYELLLAPVEDLIKNKNRLVIIPDGHLYYLPFETLCKSTSYSHDLSKTNFLIKNYSVSYHHSATLWLNSAEKSKNKIAENEGFIGFAPVFDNKTNNGLIISREWMPDMTYTNLANRSISADLKRFNSLPYSEEEIKSVVKLFDKKGKDAKGYFYQDANEDNFKQNVGKYNYVHVASHSFANDVYPNLSGIAFSQPDTIGVDKKKLEDGILYAGETYNLDLTSANLIVLSSCQSGLGKLVKGEGMLSLSRGFLYSGTPNIIFSLWSVKDEQTKDLMIHFYKNVLKGKDYATAMRIAKLKLIKDPETALPKYWAAWVLLGK